MKVFIITPFPDVIHSFIYPLARNYPLLPDVDYDASANYFDIGFKSTVQTIFQILQFIPQDFPILDFQMM